MQKPPFTALKFRRGLRGPRGFGIMVGPGAGCVPVPLLHEECVPCERPHQGSGCHRAPGVAIRSSMWGRSMGRSSGPQ
eukprot:10432653-Lingulodinium_polyedra.AAC.1